MKKLVRDKIPAIIEASGRTPVYTDDLSQHELKYYVLKKIVEEAAEIVAATSKKQMTVELADLLEVMRKLAEVNKIEWGDVLRAKHEKAKKAGAFKKNYVLEIEDE